MTTGVAFVGQEVILLLKYFVGDPGGQRNPSVLWVQEKGLEQGKGPGRQWSA